MTEYAREELIKINAKLQAHNEADDQRFGEISKIGGDNNRALGRIEATLEQHGVILLNIEDEAKITNGRVTKAEKEIEIAHDRASQLAILEAGKLAWRQRVVIGLSGGAVGTVLLVTLKLLGVA